MEPNSTRVQEIITETDKEKNVLSEIFLTHIYMNNKSLEFYQDLKIQIS